MGASFTSLADLAIIIIAGSIGGYIALRMRLPSIVGYILAGLIISTIISISGVQYNLNSEFVTKAAQLGVAFLLFAAGIEFSVNNIKKIRNLVIFGTVIEAIAVVIFGTVIMQFFGLNLYESFFIAILVSTSSTAFVLKMLEQREELSSKSSNIMIGWLVMQDILAIILFLLIKTYAPEQTGQGVNLLDPILKCIALFVFTFAVGKYVVPRLFKKIAETKSQELLLISVVALAVGFALFTESLGISFTLGAFLTGLALSETFLRHEIFVEIKPLRDLFSMIFFVSIGTLFQVGTLFGNIPALLAILILLIGFKIVVTFIINLVFNIHPKNAIKVALGLAQIGEFAFLTISIAQSHQWIGEKVYSLVLISTIITMTLTPFLYSYSDEVYNFVQAKVRKNLPGVYRRFFLKHLSEEVIVELSNHIIICGYGKVGKYVTSALSMIKEDYIVIELDSNLAQAAEIEGHQVIFGDATNIDILNRAGLKDAKSIIIALPENNTLQLQNFVTEIKNVNPKIEILMRSRGTITEIEDINSIVEPEFEAAVRIIQKLNGLSDQDRYALTRKVRSFRKREMKAELSAVS